MGKPDPERQRAVRGWKEAFGYPPPAYLSVDFMHRAMAHEEQCRRHGRLPNKLRRELRSIAAGQSVSRAVGRQVRTGAHLVREWNGRTYQVEVVEDGYRLDGKTWPSLSAVARHITGTAWSGPRFFGLKGRGGAKQ
ncbi:DUF2924 domain-containing protein [Psychromarinibacter halotolerans]|uniref:DUF2924 domain-containing protein n=1 Tax=Psychromarinibacter halotolerans TaxID=1775175 RepID=A0ABV7GSI7_9RHOB|nr:DUF2924 domain-containing protein [Psychromarinibacter halotolerans]MDF0596899.1 DUF2924 domain-containing protein [Psychromarinibacter halotolerans]